MIDFNLSPFIGREEEYIMKAIKENRVICGDGPFTKKCNEWFENNFKTNKALLTTSCTHALEMASFIYVE
ncbi:hypothetical protein KPL39_03315 [Clostridium gasigenes]|uniref:hypothetical protein n=1 Tax=Clostridium gasigenes TaxID=94869 RepID=UPI001C0E78B9|nr:hypothetical protein [Clostridium gasigenes]MBU3135293.1 hypothetical protein [Clostridium gasigenes]